MRHSIWSLKMNDMKIFRRISGRVDEEHPLENGVAKGGSNLGRV